MTAEASGSAERASLLRAISYELLSWEEVPTVPRDVDQVSTAVLLHFDGGSSIRFRWALRPGVERLSIDGWMPGDPTVETRVEDVTDRWPGFFGKALRRLDFALQDVGSGPEPYACRLHFESELSLVIALGELNEGSITYIPDSLIVTSSPDRAASYRPPAAWDNTWGSGDR